MQNEQNSSFSSKYKCFPNCLRKCFKNWTKKNPKSFNESELNSILQKNKDLLKLDNSKINNQQSINFPFRKRIKTINGSTIFPINIQSTLQGKIRYKNSSGNSIIPIKKVQK